MTRVLDPSPENIEEAARALRNGELCAFPTETVYGLGANALNETAVRRIFAAKGRPADNPLIVHVGSVSELDGLCHVSEASRMLIDMFWPGPLTLLLPKTKAIPAVVNAGLDSVAMRMPSHPVARALISACGAPIAAPSANKSGRPSPTTAEHVLCDMDGVIPIILDGGPCEVGLESTVLDMAHETPTVLRPGGVTPEMLQRALPRVNVAASVLRPLQSDEVALSPGMRYRHYAPRGSLSLVTGKAENVRRVCSRLYDEAVSDEKNARVLALSEHMPYYGGRRAVSIGSLSRPETIAVSLFAVLRRMDAEGVERIFCEAVDTKGIGLAIMNRLTRAAGFCLIDADKECSQ